MLFGLVAVVAKAVIAIRVSIERAGRNDSAFGKRLGYREREVEKREAVAVAEPATPVTATAPATALRHLQARRVRSQAAGSHGGGKRRRERGHGDSPDLGGCHSSSRGDELNERCHSR